MHKTVTITAAIVGASALVADLIFSAKTFFRHKKMLTKLCDENAELLATNTHLKAQLATYQQREKMLREGSFKREQDLDAAREEIKQLKLKLAASENKFKQAAEHINVLRIDLNRKNNKRKNNKNR